MQSQHGLTHYHDGRIGLSTRSAVIEMGPVSADSPHEPLTLKPRAVLEPDKLWHVSEGLL